MVIDVEEKVGGRAAWVVVTDGDDGDGGKGVCGGVMSASIIPGSLIALHHSCPALT